MHYSKLIGTPLSQLSDDDTVKEVIQKIARNQQSLYAQMMEIVKFFNAIYSPETDEETTFTSVINAGNIVRVTVKNGILYIAYKTDNNLRDVIKFRLSDVDFDPDSSTPTGRSGFIVIKNIIADTQIQPLPDPEEMNEGDYVIGDGFIYRLEDEEWVRTEISDAYVVYDNSLHHYIDGDLVTVIDASSKTHNARLVQIDGIIPDKQGIHIEDTAYAGEDNGVVLLYPGSVTAPPEVLLAVPVDTGTEVITEYYRKWEAVGRHPGSESYDITDWDRTSFMWKDGNNLRVANTSGVGVLTEVAKESKSDKVAKSIRLWGDDYTVIEDWKEGELWYDTTYDETTDTYANLLKECISPTIDNLQSVFATISFKEGVLYYVEQNNKWYAWNGEALYEISSIDLLQRVSQLEDAITALEGRVSALES